MITDFEPEYVTPTPEEVLELLRDMYRQQCEIDFETVPGQTLTFESTIAEWRFACDLVAWRRLGRAFNEIWDLRESDKTWRGLLTPAKKRTLGDVCAFLAPRIKLPRVRPANVLGRECLSAGAFLTIRTMLKRAGANVDNVAPSTPLAEYTRHHPGAFLDRISRLAPNVLPPVKVHSPYHDNVFRATIAGFMIMFMGGCLQEFAADRVWLQAIGIFLVVIGCPLVSTIWIAGLLQPLLRIHPRSVTFGELRTFKDLSVLMAEHIAADKAPQVQ